MKKIFLFFVFIISLTYLFAYPWGHRYPTVQSWQDTTINKGTSLTFSVEWGEGDWTHSDLGYGLTTDGTGWTWVDIPWFEDGEGSNKRCKTTVTFNTAGKYYYAYRMEKPTGTYSYQHGSDQWSENVATLSAVSYVEVNETPLPVILNSFTAIMVNNISTLNWITSSEENNMGWNIYRAPSENFGQAEKINTGFIPGAGTTTQETRYVYKDVFEPEYNVYYYWLESINFAGESNLSRPIVLNIEEYEDENVPINLLQYGLHQNYPNPFNPTTEISFILKENSNVTLEIYNLKGQKVKTLLYNTPVEKNILKSVTWRAESDEGKTVASGVYLYKLSYGKKSFIKRMLLTK